jgi:DnaJ-class molecular chaperone
MKDLYSTLGVSEGADAETIKKAYRALAKQNHPDATGGDKKKTERFKEIGDAYAVLSDPKRRKEYDRLRHAPVGTDGMPQGFDADTFSQIFGDYGGGGQGHPFGDLFSTLFGGAAGRSQASGPGADTLSALEVSFREAALGTQRIIRTGSGSSVEVKVPPGVESGTRLRVPGQGMSRRGRAGDLYLDIHILPDPHFTRQGLDVELSLPLTVSEALLGTHVDVPTVDGTVRLTIPPGTSSGAKMRLRGKGVKHSDGRRGDQFCKVEIVVPKIPSDDLESRRLVEELERRVKPGKVRNF